MIIEAINKKQKQLGYSNRFICERLDITESTYSQFTNFKKTLRFAKLEQLLELLKLELTDN